MKRMKLRAGLMSLWLAACGPMAAARAEPALWLVQSKTARVYLFGTLHILPKPVDWYGTRTAAAFKASDALWEEADVGLTDPGLVAHLMAQAISPDYDLWAALPAPTAHKLRGQLQHCGMQDALVAHTRPWMAAMIVTVCQVMGDAGHKPGAADSSPEASLLAHAHADGKTIGFFETAEQQIGYMSGATPQAQLAQLRQAIDEAASGHDDFAATETAWLGGDVAAIAASVAHSKTDDAAFYQTVFPQRNARFASRIETMLQGHGTIFVAIGAGHLAGPDSVQSMLAAHGINAVRCGG